MRAKVNTCLVMAALLTGGCGNDELDRQLGQLACPAFMDAYVAWARIELPPPTEVPSMLQAAVEERGKYVPGDDHPLADVVTGTVMDDLATLDGCWATVMYEPIINPESFEPVIDPDTGQPVEVEKVTVMCFDSVNRRATKEQWVDRAFVDDAAGLFCPPFDGLTNPSHKAGFLSIEYSYEVIRDGMIFIQGVDGNGGQIEDDGTIGFNLGMALAVSINASDGYPMLMTLHSDYLKSREGGFEPDDLVIGEDEEYAKLWIRVR